MNLHKLQKTFKCYLISSNLSNRYNSWYILCCKNSLKVITLMKFVKPSLFFHFTFHVLVFLSSTTHLKITKDTN